MPSAAVLLLHLRRLDRFLKRQGLHGAAHTLERESLVYFDAAHLQNLVRGGRWSAACSYLGRFSPLFEPEGKGTNQQYTALLHSLGDHSLLAYLARRGEHPDELNLSMASEQARGSVDWDNIKLTTLEKIREFLRLRSDLQCSLRMRSPPRIPAPSEIIPLGLRGSRRHPRKRVDRKPASELARFLQKKRRPSSQERNHSGDSAPGLGTTVVAGTSGGEAEEDASKLKAQAE